MSFLGSSTQRRLWAGLLIASLLPLAVQAPVPPRGPSAALHPADWLEAQVKRPTAAAAGERSSQKAFEQALKITKAAETHTLHGFLTAFLDAHARLTSAEAIATEGRSCRALVQHLRQQLADAGLDLLPLAQAGAPPVAPPPLARLMMLAAAAGPLAEQVAPLGSPADGADRARAVPSFSVFLRQRAVSIVSGGLLRVLFSGRSLGP